MISEKRMEKPKFHKKINIREYFSNEEIKILKNLNPEINNLFKYTLTKKNININLLNINTNNNIYTPIFVLKEKFYKLILEEIQKYFIKEKNRVISKVIGLLVKEIISVSKVLEENKKLNEFFTNLTKRKNINIDTNKKSHKLNLSIYDYSKKKYQKEIDRIRSKSERHYSPLIKNNISNKNICPDIKSLFKVTFKSKNKNTSYDNEYFDEKDKNTYNENEYNDNGYLNDKNTNDTIKNITFNENGICNVDNKEINKPKKSFNRLTFKQNNKLIKSKKTNSNKHNIFYKPKISTKKINNTIYKKNKEKEKIKENHIIQNTNKHNNKSILKRTKFNLEHYSKYEQNSLNKSYSPKKNKKLDEDKEINSPNMSIIKFLNYNSDVLKNIETSNFDIFNLDKKIGKENTLSLIGYYIFNRFGFYEIINYNKFEKWCKKISEGYHRENPYHTDLHAADVTHTCLLYFKIGKVNEILKLSKSSKCSLFLSCICHDYKHPGVTNNYLKETKNIIALTYNDNSILENMHISEAFKLINSKDEYNIFDKIDNNIYKQLRKEMISCVLATDMTFHNYYVDFMKEQINKVYNINGNNKNGKTSNDKDNNIIYQNYMNLLIHSADISNPTKPFNIYFKWAVLVVNEFFEQGDKEKELGITCTFDRNKMTLYQSQLGFINFIEIPFYSLFSEIFKKLKFYFEELNNNKDKLINMQKEEENNKKINNNNIENKD